MHVFILNFTKPKISDFIRRGTQTLLFFNSYGCNLPVASVSTSGAFVVVFSGGFCSGVASTVVVLIVVVGTAVVDTKS